MGLSLGGTIVCQTPSRFPRSRLPTKTLLGSAPAPSGSRTIVPKQLVQPKKMGARGEGALARSRVAWKMEEIRALTQRHEPEWQQPESRETNATLTGVSPNKESKDLRQFPLPCGCHWTFSSLAFISIEVTTSSGWPLAEKKSHAATLFDIPQVEAHYCSFVRDPAWPKCLQFPIGYLIPGAVRLRRPAHVPSCLRGVYHKPFMLGVRRAREGWHLATRCR